MSGILWLQNLVVNIEIQNFQSSYQSLYSLSGDKLGWDKINVCNKWSHRLTSAGTKSVEENAKKQ